MCHMHINRSEWDPLEPASSPTHGPAGDEDRGGQPGQGVEEAPREGEAQILVVHGDVRGPLGVLGRDAREAAGSAWFGCGVCMMWSGGELRVLRRRPCPGPLGRSIHPSRNPRTGILPRVPAEVEPALELRRQLRHVRCGERACA